MNATQAEASKKHFRLRQQARDLRKQAQYFRDLANGVQTVAVPAASLAQLLVSIEAVATDLAEEAEKIVLEATEA